jgi:phosphoserine aminotransferase
MRVYNFAAGPAMLPLEVLEQARAELTDWHGAGASVMEISHRGKAFVAVAAEAESDLRALLAIPANYKVLFVQGGATLQFAAIPLNLAAAGAGVDYVNTGAWSAKALAEARRHARVNVIADGKASNYFALPPASEWRPSADAAYLHYTPNETISGLEFHAVPESRAPLVADMSSTLLSRPIDVERFGLIYAGAQKNIGPAGLTVVIVREDLLGRARADIPTVLDYRAVAAENSMLNTPPTFAWYLAGLVFKWLRRQGGLAAIAERNRAKAELLYRYIDGSGWYRNPIDPPARSWMNVTFRLKEPALEAEFAAEAAAAGLTNLDGHRSVGGMRASLYNAMPLAGVEALVAFMRDFARRRG